MTSFPSKKEIQEICTTTKCPRCKKNKSQPMMLFGTWAVGYCDNCVDRMKKMAKDDPLDAGMGGNALSSVWTDSNGNNIPVNRKGNIIHTTPKYERKKGKKPLW